jgi:BTB/POZ domain
MRYQCITSIDGKTSIVSKNLLHKARMGNADHPFWRMQPSDQVVLTEILNERANLINNPDSFSDVTFLVGPNETEVTAHKAFLVSVSKVFKAMFSSNFASDAKIKVPDMEVEPFIQVLFPTMLFNNYSGLRYENLQ